MSYQPKRMRFGAFFAPFHNDRTSPTFALERDFELIQHLDLRDFDEAWIGEHHSGAYECIASPEVFIATAAERTRNIRFGTGVSSLSYHQPLVLADRIAQLDHQTRGRLIFGVGPGQLIADAYMMGIDPQRLRERMEESLDVLVRLLDGETVTAKTDWFTLNEARMHILPYQANLEIAVASAISPAGARLAGKHGVAMLSVAASSPQGFKALADSWQICEARASEFGKSVNRDTWRVVTPFHIAETREQARRDLEFGLLDMFNYFHKFGGELFPQVKDLDEAIDVWTTGGLGAFGVGIVGTPDDLIAHIEKLQNQSGGFGSFLSLVHNAADFEATKKSYDLVAQYVMPHFQHSNINRTASLDWAASNADRFMAEYMGGIEKAIKVHDDDMASKGKKVG
ncbi:LLM class flavin-dependent oxidoreductase [Parahaliea sp. F7430]|uniref:LLM class flavin-dependent oxidoreductase n=1 Tax=Sediminihaliea albiluteola TaxID=2758564 RepID=A0A7W2TUX6_9GAMM|nr:LLM class flavin-dependent oxidoreductase [Sediminihaliea albiluteola]MBA6412364.1 LLM class flavin-dependent oxidoreductase [Sediminihaliea albiluteola]